MNPRFRVLLPNRRQMEFRASDLELLLPEGHRARVVWAYVERQDLKRFYAGIRAVEGGVGRAAIAPEILLSLMNSLVIAGSAAVACGVLGLTIGYAVVRLPGTWT